jgi:hypothetical protein
MGTEHLQEQNKIKRLNCERAGNYNLIPSQPYLNHVCDRALWQESGGFSKSFTQQIANKPINFILFRQVTFLNL